MKIVLLIFANIFLASCGVKNMPEHPEGSRYPNTYPEEIENDE